ncbi:MAG: hypothetical protein ACKVP3_29065 [Hyphomicrobiaceae bacterium]
MAYTIAAPKPSPFQTLNYVFARILGLLGLASIVESAKIWVGFFREAIDLYQNWVRVPLHNLLMTVWPSSWPTLPHISIDLLIIWTSFFAAANYHVIREDGRNIFRHIYAIENNLMKPQSRALFNTIIKTITISLVGPILYPVLAIADLKRARGRGQLIITNWIIMKPRAILWYVAQQIAVVILLMFISYQMKMQNII